MISRRLFLTSSCVLSLDALCYAFESKTVIPENTPDLPDDKKWQFHGWTARIFQKECGYFFRLSYGGVSGQWGVTPRGRQQVKDLRPVFHRALDFAEKIEVCQWTRASVARMVAFQPDFNRLTCWWASCLHDVVVRNIPGLLPAWNKDAWGQCIIEMSDGKSEQQLGDA